MASVMQNTEAVLKNLLCVVEPTQRMRIKKEKRRVKSAVLIWRLMPKLALWRNSLSVTELERVHNVYEIKALGTHLGKVLGS